jgi:hypothetical protein
MNSDGWIKIHRKTLDHWLYNEYRPLTKREAWENMLLWANYANSSSLIKGQLIECKRGQLLYSLETYAQKFVWSVGQVRNFFELLKKDGMIKVEGLKYTTRLTICNYETYQDIQQTDNKLTTNSEQTDNKLTTFSQQQEKKDKKEKNNKKDKNIESGENATTPDIEKRKIDFKNCLWKKAVTDRPEYAKNINEIKNFFEYWSEHSENGKKMRFEKEKVFDVCRRMDTWFNKAEKYLQANKQKQSYIKVQNDSDY